MPAAQMIKDQRMMVAALRSEVKVVLITKRSMLFDGCAEACAMTLNT